MSTCNSPRPLSLTGWTSSLLRYLLMLSSLMFATSALGVSINSVYFSDSRIANGGTSTLHWSAKALYCKVDGDRAQERLSGSTVNGSKVYRNLTADRTVTVECFEGLNASVYKTATVIVDPEPVKPTAPGGIYYDSRVVGSSVEVTWSAAGNAPTGYTLQTLKSGNVVKTQTLAATTRTKSISGLTPGNYTFRVKATNDYGASSYKTGASLTVVSPLTISTASTTSGSFSITWTPTKEGGVPKVEEYFGGVWTQVETLSATDGGSLTRSYNRTTNGTYRYRVQEQECISTCSHYFTTPTVTVVVNRPPTPSMPTSLDAAVNNDDSVRFSWLASTNNVTAYQLDSKKQNTSSWSRKYTGTSHSVDVAGYTSGLWDFRIRACNTSSVCSDWRTLLGYHYTKPEYINLSTSVTESGSYQLNWSIDQFFGSGAELWEVDAGSKSTLIATLDVHQSTSSKSFSKTQNGTYRYNIIKKNCFQGDCVADGNVGPVSVEVAIPPPTTPTNFQVSASSGSTTASFSWGTSSGNFNGYLLERSLDQVTWIPIYSGLGTSTTVADFMPGSWYFRIRACGSGCSGYATAEANIGVTPPVLSASVAESVDGTFQLSWSGVNTVNPAYANLLDVTNASAPKIVEHMIAASGSFDFTKYRNGTHRYRIEQYYCVEGAYGEVPDCEANIQSQDVSISINIPALELDLTAAGLSAVNTVGRMPYIAKVTNGGAAAISIPVEVVPGINGWQPKLAINYTSNRGLQLARRGMGEDNVGSGWRVSGLSKIRTCSLLLADEGRFHGGDFQGQNHYLDLCLDGQPLIETNPVSKNEQGELIEPMPAIRDYVLWNDQGLKVRRHSSSKFEVFYPDGSVSEYGGSAESASTMSVGGKFQGVWRISKRTDAFNNAIHYDYYNDEARRITLPKSIRYGNSDDAVIEFGYQMRKEEAPVPAAYESSNGLIPPPGSIPYLDWWQVNYVSYPVAINKITVKHDGEKIRDYTLVQEAMLDDSLLRLKYAQLCAYDQSAAANCLQPLSITWKSSVDSIHKGRVERIDDHNDSNFSNWVDFTYAAVTGRYFSETPFGSPPVAPPKYMKVVDDSNIAVSRMRKNNGVGGSRNFNYHYQGEGLLSEKGWGFMGYYAQRTHDAATGIYSYRQFAMDHRYKGKVAAEVSSLGIYGGGQLLSKSHTVWDALDIHHSNYRFPSQQGPLYQLPVRSNYVYAKQRINYTYELGTELGVSAANNSVQFTEAPYSQWTSANGGTAEAVQDWKYPMSKSSSTKRWATSASEPVSVTWGVYKTFELNGVNRAVQSESDLKENRETIHYLVGFPVETRLEVYDGDIGGAPIQTSISRSTPHIYNGRKLAKIGRSTQFIGDPDLELSTKYNYNAAGLIWRTQVSGENVELRESRASSFLYGRYPRYTKNTAGHLFNNDYDPRFGLLTSTTGPNKLTTSNRYDAFGRVLVTTSTDNIDVTTRYDFCSDLGDCPIVNGVAAYSRVMVTSPISPDSWQYLDSLGREIRSASESFDGASAVYRDTHYNNLGQVSAVSLPYFIGEAPSYIRYEYDALGRIEFERRPDNSFTETRYTVEGKLAVKSIVDTPVDSDGAILPDQTRISYRNARGEIVKTTDAASSAEEISTEFFYKATGLTDYILVDGVEVASFDYDAAGNRTQLTDQNVGTVTSRYNGLGQLLSQTDNAQQLITYGYDLLGCQTTETSGDGVQNWVYDTAANGIGMLDYSEFVDADSGFYHKVDLSYDTDSKLSDSVTDIRVPGFADRQYTQSFSYDSYGRSDTVSYPSGITAQSHYNAQGFIERVSDAGGQDLQAVGSVDALGNVTQLDFGNGVSSARFYNPLNGQLQTVDTYKGQTQLQSSVFNWRSNGLLDSRSSNVGQLKTETFGYDALSRLTSSNTVAGGITRNTATSYALDGNILSKTASNTAGNDEVDVTGYQYGTTANAGPNAVSYAVIGGVANDLYYDANGAITHYDASTGADKFVDWTARGKPWRITKGAANDELNPEARDEFAYGVDGYRYYKKSTWQNDAASQQIEHTFYVGDFEDIVVANDPDYKRVEKTRIGDSVMHIRRTAHNSVVDEGLEFLHKDHLGSVEAITDVDGNLLVQMSFDAFGSRRKADWAGALSDVEMKELLDDMAINTSRGYTGHEQLDRTGLIHMNGRVYDPVLGRFLSADPLVQAPYFSQSYNRYTYAWNNPLGIIDPSGYGNVIVHDVGSGYTISYTGQTGTRTAGNFLGGNDRASSSADSASTSMASGDSGSGSGSFDSGSTGGYSYGSCDGGGCTTIGIRGGGDSMFSGSNPFGAGNTNYGSYPQYASMLVDNFEAGYMHTATDEQKEIFREGKDDGLINGIAMAVPAEMLIAAVAARLKIALIAGKGTAFQKAVAQLSKAGQQNVRTLQGWAKSKGWTRKPGDGPEVWGVKGAKGGFSWRLKIKPEASNRQGLQAGSNQPRFDARLNASGTYVNPFTGQTGTRAVGTHIPLEKIY